MSASRTKKERQNDFGAGLSQKQKREQAEARKSRRNTIVYTIIGIIAAILVAALLVWDSGVIQKSMTAVTIGDRKYTAVDVDYYYYSSYSTYANYASTYGLDTSKPLDEQEVYDGYTWDQMLKDSALKMLANVSVLYQEAQANGYELSQDGQDQVEIAVNNVASYASVYNIDEDYYLQRAYGKYMNAKEYERIYTEYQTAQEYAQYKGTSFDVNEDEIQSYYNEHSNALDTIDYNCYLVRFDRTTTDSEGTKVDLDDATIEANRTEAEAHAQEILDALVAGDKDKAAELAETYGATDDSNLAGIENSGYADWMSDVSHQAGSYGLDENISASDNETLLGYFAIYVNDRYLDDYNGVNVRVIRDAGTAGDDGTYDMSNPLSDQEAILQKYESGDKTAEAFGALADEYSQDSSTYEGGLRENVSKKAYNAEITAWLFDDARVEGDVKGFTDEDTHNCYTFYYVGRSDTPYWKTVCISNVQNDKYGDWLDEVTANYPTENGTAMRFVG